MNQDIRISCMYLYLLRTDRISGYCRLYLCVDPKARLVRPCLNEHRVSRVVPRVELT